MKEDYSPSADTLNRITAGIENYAAHHPPLASTEALRDALHLALAVIGSLHPDGTDPYVLDAERKMRAALALAAPAGEPADEIERLRAFAHAVMEDWPDVGLDGADLQELSLKHGLLELKVPKPTEPCGENCNCASYFADDEWAEGIECYRLTALVAAPRARELGNE